MPSGPGSLDAEGIWQFGEDDSEALASDLLNLLAASTSDQFTIDRANHGVKFYRWASSSGRTGQTGMQAGDFGFQADTGVVYRYSGSAWKGWASDWITYTPTLSNFAVGTGGSALSSWKYRYEGGRIRVKFTTIQGSSGASVGTNPTFSLPFAAATLAHNFEARNGNGIIQNSAVSTLHATMFMADDTDVNDFRVYYLGPSPTALTATAPHTWAAGSRMDGELVYDPA